MSTTPDAIQLWAAAQAPIQAAIATELQTLGTTIPSLASGVANLDTLLTTLQNSPGEITPADQATLDAATAQNGQNAALLQTLLNSLQAINTSAPGTVAPVVPAVKLAIQTAAKKA